MATKQKTSKKSQKSLYFEDRIWKKLSAIAKEEKRSINTVVEMIIEKELLIEA